MNRKQIRLNNNFVEINIPIELTWDFYGQQDSINEFEETVLDQILNSGQDFEVNRFDHASYFTTKIETSINYDYYLYDPTPTNNLTLPGTWVNSYTPKFTQKQIFYQESNFKKSFWKLDLYDKQNPLEQKNYITIILPTHQGLDQVVQIGVGNQSQIAIKRPSYRLDYIGDKEGFFIYWLKKRDFLDINTFYMSAKFFNGETGQFIKMMNRSQASLTNTSNPFNFSSVDYFYYRVDLNYSTQKYEVFDTLGGTRFGTTTNPIKWYEYVNPT